MACDVALYRVWGEMQTKRDGADVMHASNVCTLAPAIQPWHKGLQRDQEQRSPAEGP